MFGWGEVTLEWHTRGVVGAIEDLSQLLIGEDPTRIEHLWQMMWRQQRQTVCRTGSAGGRRGPGLAYPLTVRLGILGDVVWVFVPGELYQAFQLTLRERFAPRHVFVTTLTNEWQPGYIPPASTYGYEIYQEVIAATSPGCMESLIETVSRRLTSLLN